MRPLRIEFPGVVYHITSRGNARQTIYTDDEGWEAFRVWMFQALPSPGFSGPLPVAPAAFRFFWSDLVMG